MIEIVNPNDQLCMARAIGVAWARQNQVTQEEWKALVGDTQGQSMLDLTLHYRKVPASHFKNLLYKKRKDQYNLAKRLCELTDLPTDRPASINDITRFEELLGVRILVIPRPRAINFSEPEVPVPTPICTSTW